MYWGGQRLGCGTFEEEGDGISGGNAIVDVVDDDDETKYSVICQQYW